MVGGRGTEAVRDEDPKDGIHSDRQRFGGKMFKAETSAEKQPEGHRKTWGSQGRRRGPG